MKWSPQQERALRSCSSWVKDDFANQVFYIAGYAGTGKTTLAQQLVRGGNWLFAAFTGKASHVLRQKGCWNAQTIHSLIYRPSGESKGMEIENLKQEIKEIFYAAGPERVLLPKETLRVEQLTKLIKHLEEENQPRFVLWGDSPLADADVDGIVIDEVSMVDERLGKDLESFGKKILVLGDPAQLPPVGAGGYFTNREPDIMLTEVHRHAKESEILHLATLIREGSPIGQLSKISHYTGDVLFIPRGEPKRIREEVLAADQVLCGLNASRHAMNRRHRELIGMNQPIPMKNDRLVCLKNDHNKGLFNGSQWLVEDSVADLDNKTADMAIKSEDSDKRRIPVEAWLHHMLGCSDELAQMGFERRELSEFDWSYALTVHKAQGSQWEKVVLFNESSSFRGHATRWLYTGITRASKKLVVVV